MPAHKPGSEFDIIARHFRPLAADAPGALGLTDDAAVLDPPPGQQLVVTTDALVAGVHFLETLSPQDIAHKVVGVNLSDLAAMGATPHAVFLAAQFPQDIDEDWIAAFAAGLKEHLGAHDVRLMGGDTVTTPGPLAFTVTALGYVAQGRALTRAGAGAGDDLYVSGTIGDGALGLLCQTGALAKDAHLMTRYARPQPRCALGAALAAQGLVTACADISDGLAADAGHIARASNVHVTIHAAAVPLSDAARGVVEANPQLWRTVLAGGDDYELVFTAPPSHGAAIQAVAAQVGVDVTRIGEVRAGADRVDVLDTAEELLDLGPGGYRHM